MTPRHRRRRQDQRLGVQPLCRPNQPSQPERIPTLGEVVALCPFRTLIGRIPPGSTIDGVVGARRPSRSASTAPSPR
jgi:hypothetical protein